VSDHTPRFLGPGRAGADCLADVLGRGPLGIEGWALHLVPCAPEAATALLVTIDSTDPPQHAEHVMRVVRRVGNDPADWIVRSKLGKRGGRYEHIAGQILARSADPFPLDPRDRTFARGTWDADRHIRVFPGYPGRLVPVRRHEP